MEGERAIAAVVERSPDALIELLAAEGAIVACTVPGAVRRFPPAAFSRIVSSVTPQGVAAVIRLPQSPAEGPFLRSLCGNVLLCEHIQDPGNLGTLIRTAAALDVGGVLLSHHCADPFGPKAVQAAAGTMLSVPLLRTPRYLECAGELRERGYTLVATTPDGDPAGFERLTPPAVLMLGSEGEGLSEAACRCAHIRVCIPMNRTRAESLNVAIAGGVCLHRLYLQGRGG